MALAPDLKLKFIKFASPAFGGDCGVIYGSKEVADSCFGPWYRYIARVYRTKYPRTLTEDETVSSLVDLSDKLIIHKEPTRRQPSDPFDIPYEIVLDRNCM